MSYLRKKEDIHEGAPYAQAPCTARCCVKRYEIIPDGSYAVVHNCAGCGQKKRFINTKHFRVNANGNKLDVWLIYQCERCRHTLNIPVYERIDKKRLPEKEYQLFLDNDEALAEEYGMDMAFFKKNRLEADIENFTYTISHDSAQCEAHSDTGCPKGYTISRDSAQCSTMKPEQMNGHTGQLFVIYNPYGVQIRPERIVSTVLKISRSAAKKMLRSGQLAVREKGAYIEISL